MPGGPSGCGKSTLLDLMAGLSRPSAGEIEIGRGASDQKARLAVVFQRPALFPWKTVAGNIAFGLRAQGMGRAEAGRQTDEFIAMVGLEGFARAYPHELWGGMAQRVGIARALAAKVMAGMIVIGAIGSLLSMAVAIARRVLVPYAPASGW